MALVEIAVFGSLCLIPEMLFQKFARLSATPTGTENSTGLGLSICKKMVDLLGGRIWAESDGKDMGSIFIVEIPQTSPTKGDKDLRQGENSDI